MTEGTALLLLVLPSVVLITVTSRPRHIPPAMTSFIQAFTGNNRSNTPLTWQHLLTAALRIPPPSSTATNAAHPLPALLFLIDAIAILRALQNGSLAGHFVDGELDTMEMLDHFLSYLGELVSFPLSFNRGIMTR